MIVAQTKRQCGICGTEFSPSHYLSKFCSGNCRDAARKVTLKRSSLADRARKRDALKAASSNDPRITEAEREIAVLRAVNDELRRVIAELVRK